MMGATALASGVTRDDRLSSQARAAICRLMLQFDEEVGKRMGPVLSAKPYFYSLFSIYLAELEGRKLFQACLTVDEVASKAHRRAGRLEELGAIRRTGDTLDHRRTDLSLTPPMRQALAPLIDRVAADSMQIASLLQDGSGAPSALIPKCRAWYRFHDATEFGPSDMTIVRGKVIAGGRIALPAEMRRALGLENGDTVLFELQGDEVRIRPAKSALRRVQERLRSFAPDDGLVSQEFIAERRAEAARA